MQHSPLMRWQPKPWGAIHQTSLMRSFGDGGVLSSLMLPTWHVNKASITHRDMLHVGSKVSDKWEGWMPRWQPCHIIKHKLGSWGRKHVYMYTYIYYIYIYMYIYILHIYIYYINIYIYLWTRTCIQISQNKLAGEDPVVFIQAGYPTSDPLWSSILKDKGPKKRVTIEQVGALIV